mgnify:CR=1 FL=1
MFKGFRARLIVFSILAVAPIFGMRFWEIWQERDAAIAEGRAQILRLAQTAADRQADLIYDTRALLGVIASIPVLRTFDNDACNAAIRKIADLRPWIEGMAVTGADGTIRCAGKEAALGVNLADRQYFREVTSGKQFVVSELLFNRITRRPSVVTAHADRSIAGDPRIFLATLKLSWLEDLANEVTEGFNGDIFVVDASGRVIASQIRYGVNARPEESGTILNGAAQGSEGVLELKPYGKSGILFGYATIPDANARIFIGRPVDNVLDSVYRQSRSALRGLALAFIAILFVAWIGSELLFLRPTRALMESARGIADGDYRTRADVELGPHEFRKLGKTFNVMVDRLEALADVDPLTELANRRQLDRHLQDVWRRFPTDPIAIAMIDVDNFKPYNDFFGHVRGDKCLQAIAGVVKAFGRRADDLSARFGGEEFTLVIHGFTAEQMAEHCERLRIAVENLAIPQTEGIGGSVTVSIGVVSVIPVTCPDLEVAIRDADRALYAAKKAGRNKVAVHGRDSPVHVLGQASGAS